MEGAKESSENEADESTQAQEAGDSDDGGLNVRTIVMALIGLGVVVLIAALVALVLVLRRNKK